MKQRQGFTCLSGPINLIVFHILCTIPLNLSQVFHKLLQLSKKWPEKIPQEGLDKNLLLILEDPPDSLCALAVGVSVCVHVSVCAHKYILHMRDMVFCFFSLFVQNLFLLGHFFCVQKISVHLSNDLLYDLKSLHCFSHMEGFRYLKTGV